MRKTTAAAVAAIALLSSAGPAAKAGDVTSCSDRNMLNSAAVDARLVAIRLYYQGIIDGLGDGDRKSCLAARVLNTDKLAIVNKTLDLIERDCLPIAQAARTASEGVCP